jgi:shikimate kinase
MSRRPIFLIGYRGAGKTAVAKALAAKLGWPWFDADAVLEERAGKTIRQIFADDGEGAFRDLEALVLAELSNKEDAVIATGGGVVLRAENRQQLRRSFVVWLTAPTSVLWQRMQADPTTNERRPNLAQGGLAEIEALLAVREPLYRECADVIIESAESGPEAIASAIIQAKDSIETSKKE